MTKHTPGPWKCVNDTEALLWDIVVVDPQDRGFIACLSQTNCIPTEETEANARLIAKAPEMLEALRELIESAQCLYDIVDIEGVYDGEDEQVEDARRITKARTIIAKIEQEKDDTTEGLTNAI